MCTRFSPFHGHEEEKYYRRFVQFFQRNRPVETRTSKNTWVGREASPIIDTIYRRAAELGRIDEALLRHRDDDERPDVPGPNSLAEQLQLVHYGVSEEYTCVVSSFVCVSVYWFSAFHYSPCRFLSRPMPKVRTTILVLRTSRMNTKPPAFQLCCCTSTSRKKEGKPLFHDGPIQKHLKSLPLSQRLEREYCSIHNFPTATSMIYHIMQQSLSLLGRNTS